MPWICQAFQQREAVCVCVCGGGGGGGGRGIYKECHDPVSIKAMLSRLFISTRLDI